MSLQLIDVKSLFTLFVLVMIIMLSVMMFAGVGWWSRSELPEYPANDCGRNWFLKLFHPSQDVCLLSVSDVQVQEVMQEEGLSLHEALEWIARTFGR